MMYLAPLLIYSQQKTFWKAKNLFMFSFWCVDLYADAMMAMQNLPNRGQGLAGNQQQQLQIGQPGMPGIQQTLQGQQQHMNIQQSECSNH